MHKLCQTHIQIWNHCFNIYVLSPYMSWRSSPPPLQNNSKITFDFTSAAQCIKYLPSWKHTFHKTTGFTVYLGMQPFYVSHTDLSSNLWPCPGVVGWTYFCIVPMGLVLMTQTDVVLFVLCHDWAFSVAFLILSLIFGEISIENSGLFLMNSSSIYFQ